MSGLRIAVIGAGYWGRNLVRVFHQLGVLACVCDVRDEALAEIAKTYAVGTLPDYSTVLSDSSLNAVVLATPAAQHYGMAKQALAAGKDVYVEKPLSLSAAEGKELLQLAERAGRVLMVGHILQYHPAVLELERLVRAGELGRIQYIYSSRLNLGRVRTEENILWSFAPHDISAILFLLKEFPLRVAAHAGTYLNHDVADTSLSTFDFQNGVKAHIFVSWLHPFKEQKLTVVGSRKMAVFDDGEQDHKLVLYANQIEWVNRVPLAQKQEGEAVPLPATEPLKAEAEHFLSCIRERRQPRTDGAEGWRVLRVLEACERSMGSGGAPVELEERPLPYFAHPTAVIDQPCDIGEGTKIWHFSHIMAGAKLGQRCNLGQNVVISPEVVIGNNVKIQNNVSVYTGVILQDDVFCGPSMVFTNVVNPRSHIVRRNEYRSTLVKRGASLGANSTILCGLTVGEYSFVAAGATVIRDVPPYALMAGVPAKQIGWVCYCGNTLRGTGTLACSACSRAYTVADGECRPLEGTAPVRQHVSDQSVELEARSLAAPRGNQR